MRYLLIALLCFSTHALAQEITISPSDTTQSVVAAQKGKRVTIRLRSGLEMTGIVRDANARVVVLGGLVSRELFDAVVPLEAVDAVIIRTKQ